MNIPVFRICPSLCAANERLYNSTALGPLRNVYSFQIPKIRITSYSVPVSRSSAPRLRWRRVACQRKKRFMARRRDQTQRCRRNITPPAKSPNLIIFTFLFFIFLFIIIIIIVILATFLRTLTWSEHGSRRKWGIFPSGVAGADMQRIQNANLRALPIALLVEKLKLNEMRTLSELNREGP